MFPVWSDGVVIDRNVGRAVADLQEQAVASPLTMVDVLEEVVLDGDARCRLTRLIAVVAEDVDAAGGVPDDVVAEGDVLDRRPRRAATGIAHGEQHGIARLRGASSSSRADCLR